MAQVIAQTLVGLSREADIIMACHQSRRLANQAGFSSEAQAAIVTAILEVGHNIINYASRGEIELGLWREAQQTALTVVARDNGPGIADLELALQDGYSTGTGLGLGLPGARRLMDEFDITSTVGQGTTVVMKKWNKTNE